MKELGYGRGYRYAHDSPDPYIPQEYLPDELRERPSTGRVHSGMSVALPSG